MKASPSAAFVPVLRVILLLTCLFTARSWAEDPLLIVALDGVRYDYPRTIGAPGLAALAAGGASVERMIPSFPATTFPNFHSMATGLYPSRHGLVAMAFRDPQLERDFLYFRNSTEGFWYGGKPFWEIAQDAGIRVATYFWPGTDAGVNGKYPAYYKRYDSKVTHEERVRQVLDWLNLPEGERPGAVVVYFSDVDSAGHRFGPDSEETRAAMAKVDTTVTDLVKRAREKTPRLNVLVVSDHGVTAVKEVIDFTDDAQMGGCNAANEGSMTMLYCPDPEMVYRELTSAVRKYAVYRRNETPARWHYRDNPRIGDIVVLAKGPYILNAKPPGQKDVNLVPALKGMHGYDPDNDREMQGLLIGSGPAFRKGARLREARNVDVFPLVLELLGLKTPEGVDGDITRVRGLLR